MRSAQSSNKLNQNQESEPLISDPLKNWGEFAEPPKLNSSKRPYKGIFLALFLFFTGLLFFCHGIHKYEEYTIWDLIAVNVLAILLIIPGGFYSLIIIGIELGASGFKYQNHPELLN